MIDADTIARAVEAKAEVLRAALLAKVTANLSGDVLRSRSGALKASIVADLSTDSKTIVVTIASQGVPYAAIQEYGGRTPAHDIAPVKALALVFAGARGPVFARRIHHPGSTIPARAPLGGALDALRDEIGVGLKDAVREALGAT